ncbi:MAG TPA: InlB B-repeat-containing protein, partial [Spirochaetota bacterium]|nr:InlB B-repeat-containing protein [Spirochaetota bacterium]
ASVTAANKGTLVKSGYTFAGWNTAANGSGAAHSAGSSFEISSNITLYAQWTADPTFSVTYVGNGSTGGSVPVDGNAYLSGATVTAAKKGTLGKAGYAFAGWNTAANGSGITYEAGVAFTISSNVTLYAIWRTQGISVWAKTVTSASSRSQFCSTVVDASGNVCAAGYIKGNGAFEFGDGTSSATSIIGKYNGQYNAAVVKYDASGKALWARTPTSASYESTFYSVAVDSSGNVYAAGWVWGIGAFEFGDGTSSATSVTGQCSDYNIVIVKYDASGKALWAKTVTSASYGTRFYSITVDASGNVYAVGNIHSDGLYEFGDGSSSMTSINVDDVNCVYRTLIVKYDASGKALWAKTASSKYLPPDFTWFYSVAVDASGNVYAAGYIGSHSTYEFGDGSSAATSVTGKGSGPGSNCAVVVKYDASGNALWAKTLTSASNDSWFNSIAVDGSGNVYAAGVIRGTGAFAFGGVSVTGKFNDYNAVVVKYDASGNALWAKTLNSASGDSYFCSIVVDASGNVYSAGFISGTGVFGFDSVSITGKFNGNNALVVKYEASGNVFWAKTLTSASSSSSFSSITVDTSGNLYAAGAISGTGAFKFDSVSVTGKFNDSNAVIVKY